MKVGDLVRWNGDGFIDKQDVGLVTLMTLKHVVVLWGRSGEVKSPRYYFNVRVTEGLVEVISECR